MLITEKLNESITEGHLNQRVPFFISTREGRAMKINQAYMKAEAERKCQKIAGKSLAECIAITKKAMRKKST